MKEIDDGTCGGRGKSAHASWKDTPFVLFRPGGAETRASRPFVRCKLLAVRCFDGLSNNRRVCVGVLIEFINRECLLTGSGERFCCQTKGCAKREC